MVRQKTFHQTKKAPKVTETNTSRRNQTDQISFACSKPRYGNLVKIYVGKINWSGSYRIFLNVHPGQWEKMLE
jgi:hypothetical protein